MDFSAPLPASVLLTPEAWENSCLAEVSIREFAVVGLGKGGNSVDEEMSKTKGTEASGLHMPKSEVHFLLERGS